MELDGDEAVYESIISFAGGVVLSADALAVMYHQSIDYGNKKPSTQEALSSKATIKEEALSFQGASQLLSKIQKERQRTVREGVGFSKALEMFTSIEKYFKSINNSRN